MKIHNGTINTTEIAELLRGLPKLKKHSQLTTLREILEPLSLYKDELESQYVNHLRNEAMKSFGAGQAGFARSTDY
ncbi:hypothetical protein [Pseudoalteromonas arctica]|uniref:Uncharacterized protein n=1 Tax=Pseudoalteromonas arctica TaxID=394751 RepID=A0A7Y0HF40_9GAMM|nr:hypothetical protein [Pseudoalteromonas arctica]NMM42819.1 hypothetical protein [Pseudoalteromonas arctica]